MTTEEKKPIKAKAHFYAVCFEGMKQIAQDYGYNLIIHGSMARDFDLIAVVWNDNPKPQMDLMIALSEFLGLPQYTQKEEYSHSVIHGQRDSYVINLNRGGKFNSYTDEQWYIDISFTPYYKKSLTDEIIEMNNELTEVNKDFRIKNSQSEQSAQTNNLTAPQEGDN